VPPQRPSSGLKRTPANMRGRGQSAVAAARGKGRVGRGLNEAAEALLGMGADPEDEDLQANVRTLQGCLGLERSAWFWRTVPYLSRVS